METEQSSDEAIAMRLVARRKLMLKEVKVSPVQGENRSVLLGLLYASRNSETVSTEDKTVPGQDEYEGKYFVTFRRGGANEMFVTFYSEETPKEILEALEKSGETVESIGLSLPLVDEVTREVVFKEGSWEDFVAGKQVQFEEVGKIKIHRQGLTDAHIDALRDSPNSVSIDRNPSATVRELVRAVYIGTRRQLEIEGPSEERRNEIKIQMQVEDKYQDETRDIVGLCKALVALEGLMHETNTQDEKELNIYAGRRAALHLALSALLSAADGTLAGPRPDYEKQFTQALPVLRKAMHIAIQNEGVTEAEARDYIILIWRMQQFLGLS